MLHQAEAAALMALYAKYGVDFVCAGSVHVYRRTPVKVSDGATTYLEQYFIVPPAGSAPRTLGQSDGNGGPALRTWLDEAGWSPGSGYRGWVDIVGRTVTVYRVDASTGATDDAEDHKDTGSAALGGGFDAVPSGCHLD